MWGKSVRKNYARMSVQNQCGVIAKGGSSQDLGGKTAEIPARISKLNEIVSKISEKAKGERLITLDILLDSRESIWHSFNKYFSSTRKTKEGKSSSFLKSSSMMNSVFQKQNTRYLELEIVTENFQMVSVVLEKKKKKDTKC